MSSKQTEAKGNGVKIGKILVKRRSLPSFSRPNHWTRSKLSTSWRRPKGIDHKVRHSYKGYPPQVKVGYRTPRATRGLHPCGLRPAVVSNISELSSLDPSVDCVILSSKLGGRRLQEVQAAAVEKGFTLVNGVAGEQPEHVGEEAEETVVEQKSGGGESEVEVKEEKTDAEQTETEKEVKNSDG
ncbi:MAG: eL32 family ribosomal protein [Thermoprotei archaeon]